MAWNYCWPRLNTRRKHNHRRANLPTVPELARKPTKNREWEIENEKARKIGHEGCKTEREKKNKKTTHRRAKHRKIHRKPHLTSSFCAANAVEPCTPEIARRQCRRWSFSTGRRRKLVMKKEVNSISPKGLPNREGEEEERVWDGLAWGIWGRVRLIYRKTKSRVLLAWLKLLFIYNVAIHSTNLKI